ncbi:hypothetical protein CRG98_046385 [Punica granatum]|uniref:KIB1-4 beta-propeller domain-containing protein n=1 Tax=Punica granatum TaxID=22663 RepID=A0A2I0HPM6_PUNGR|nr:hypothetical protein CRG98_046385 [Punica granatum]
MAQKVKKQKQQRAKSEDEKLSSCNSWLNLPFSVLRLIRENPALMQNIKLTNPSEGWYTSLPPWDVNVPLKLVVLSSTLWEFYGSRKDCTLMVITGMDHTASALYIFSWNAQMVLLVLLISQRSRVGSEDDVEVFRLDEDDKLSWVKMKSFGERALFVVDDCCISVLASDMGCKRNCA